MWLNFTEIKFYSFTRSFCNVSFLNDDAHNKVHLDITLKTLFIILLSCLQHCGLSWKIEIILKHTIINIQAQLTNLAVMKTAQIKLQVVRIFQMTDRQFQNIKSLKKISFSYVCHTLDNMKTNFHCSDVGAIGNN